MQFNINSRFVTLQDVPVTSAITDPPAGASIDPDEDEVTLKGYAWSGRCALRYQSLFQNNCNAWLVEVGAIHVLPDGPCYTAIFISMQSPVCICHR
jgi:Mo-co oxidoreductase dimerisation domain